MNNSVKKIKKEHQFFFVFFCGVVCWWLILGAMLSLKNLGMVRVAMIDCTFFFYSLREFSFWGGGV